MRNYSVTFYFKDGQVFAVLEVRASSPESAKERALRYMNPDMSPFLHNLTILPR